MEPQNDFDYVIKVLNSCENEEQLEVVNNMFNKFKKKWESKIYDLDYVAFLYIFDFEYKKKKATL